MSTITSTGPISFASIRDYYNNQYLVNTTIRSDYVASTESPATDTLADRNVHILNTNETVSISNPSLQWTGTVNLKEISGLTMDTDSGIYIAGTYASTGSLTGTSGTVTVSTPTNQVHYIGKYNSSGVPQWIARIQVNSAATFSTTGKWNMSTFSNQNVYAVGAYDTATATLYNASGASSGISLRAPSVNAATYIVKYSAAGTAAWAVSCDSMVMVASAVDSSNNVYGAGSYGVTGTTVQIYNAGNSLSPLAIRAAPANASNGFVVKWNASGVAQWIVATATMGPYGVATDSLGNVYAGGEYNSFNTTNTIYNAGNVASTLAIRKPVPSMYNQGYLLKVNSAGVAQWVVALSSSRKSIIQGVNVDGNGDAYVYGYYNGNGPLKIYNAGNVLSTVSVPSNGVYNTTPFIAKISASGQAVWATSWKGRGNQSNDSVREGEMKYMTIDANGGVYASIVNKSVSGGNVVEYSNGRKSTVYCRTMGNRTAVLLKLNQSDGALQWVKSFVSVNYFPGIASNSSGTFVAAAVHNDNANAIYNDNYTSTTTALPSVPVVLTFAPGTTTIPRPFKLLTLTTTEGMVKTFVNTHTSSIMEVRVRNELDTENIESFFIQPNTTLQLVQYSGKWMRYKPASIF